MTLRPRFLAGNYGNGIQGLKTSLPGYDVTVLADDNNVERRSFNSEWPQLARLKIAGFAAGVWTQQQWRDQASFNPVTGQYQFSRSWSAWAMRTPIQVATGLTYMPVWEERLYEPALSKVYDDYVYPNVTSTTASYSGARSYFSGPGLSPANTIWFEPFSNVAITGQTHTTPDGYPAIAAVASNFDADGPAP